MTRRHQHAITLIRVHGEPAPLDQVPSRCAPSERLNVMAVHSKDVLQLAKKLAGSPSESNEGHHDAANFAASSAATPLTTTDRISNPKNASIGFARWPAGRDRYR